MNKFKKSISNNSALKLIKYLYTLLEKKTFNKKKKKTKIIKEVIKNYETLYQFFVIFEIVI